jgi:hypothetical protein
MGNLPLNSSECNDAEQFTGAFGSGFNSKGRGLETKNKEKRVVGVGTQEPTLCTNRKGWGTLKF